MVIMIKNFKVTSSMYVFSLLLIIFVAGCVSPPKPQENLSPPIPPNTTILCNDKDCFISAANNCQDLNLTISEDIGVMKYTTSHCIFTKTILSLNDNETQEMKNLLQGKNMTCIYKKGTFDQRLVKTLIGGMEYCNGELKDDLGKLIVFS